MRADAGTEEGADDVTGVDIVDATDPSYTLTGDDQGKTVRLKVSFIDDEGNSESLTSAATAEVNKRPHFLVSNLDAGVEGSGGIQRPLSAARSGFAQAFTTGPRAGGYALGSVGVQVSHFFDESAVGDHLRVTINGVASEGGPGDAHCTLANPPSYPAPGVIAFEAPAGEVSCPQLAAGTTHFVVIEWVNPSGTGSFALIPQTYPAEESAATGEDPGGAEGWSIADQAHYLSVSSGARTWTAYDETASFKIQVKGAAVTAVNANSPATGAPTISGTPQVGETLTADPANIRDEDGLTNVSYSYQWIGDGSDIDGATGPSYTLTAGEQGTTVQVRVTFTDDDDNGETRTSEATTAVSATVPTAPQSLTVATGDQVHELVASWQAPSSNGGSDVTGYKVQWKEAADSWDTEADVSQATETGTSHTITGLTGGVEYSVRVMATNDVGDGPASTESKGTPAGGVSEQTVEPENSAPTGLPAIRGTPQVDQTLTADTATISDQDGLTSVSYRYQWITGGTDIDGATGSSHTLTASEQGQTIQVRVTFTDDRGNSESLTSEATGAVAAKPTPLTATFSNVPTSHGGSGATFTFDLAFSENVKLSYANLRDHAFTEDGGEVDKAQRKVPGSNRTWTITVKPKGNGDVIIELPATTNCGDQGAVCAKDDSGRKLSNSLSIAVSGPGE